MNAKLLKKILPLMLVAGLCLAGVGYAGYLGYKSLRQGRLLRQARQHLAKSETKRALFCVQRAIHYNGRDVEAWRLLAELFDATRSPSALLARNRIVELLPRSTEDRLALAQTAMMFRDYATATNALQGVDAAGQHTAGFHNVAGAVAAAANLPAQAEAHFLEAVRLEPQDANPQLNLAVVRLHGTNAATLNEARASLKRLSANPTNSLLRCQALRELIIDDARNKQLDTALALAADLLHQTNAVFKDQLLRLDLLHESKKPEFSTALAALRQQAANDPANLYELTTWQMAKTPVQDTLAWLQGLPRSQQTNQPAALFIAECQTALADWSALQASLRAQNWGDLEFMRHAFLTRALREQALADSAKTEWEQALATARGQKTSLIMLLRLASQWSWLTEQQNLLWAIFRQFPRDDWAFQALFQSLFFNGQTRPLAALCSERVKRFPADLAAKNNLAMTAMLLEAPEFQPYKLAREVYTNAPGNVTFISTFAFALHLQKKNAEALALLERLTPQQLENPAISGYYGLVLQATGNQAKARKYLELATKAKLLPEERKLMERALAAGG